MLNKHCPVALLSALTNRVSCTLIKAVGFFSLFKFAGNNSVSCQSFWMSATFLWDYAAKYWLFWGATAKLAMYLQSWAASACVRFPLTLEMWHGSVQNV